MPDISPFKFGIIATITIFFISGAAYSAFNQLTNDKLPGDSLIASQWNTLVENQNDLQAQISSLSVAIPTGAVMAFASNTCPTDWSEYTAAYGRFVRGIDKSGTNIDPDGQRAFGSTQDDAFESHNHGIALNMQTGASGGYFSTGHAAGNGIKSTSTGGNETRSKNVALLYCIKD